MFFEKRKKKAEPRPLRCSVLVGRIGRRWTFFSLELGFCFAEGTSSSQQVSWKVEKKNREQSSPEILTCTSIAIFYGPYY